MGEDSGQKWIPLLGIVQARSLLRDLDLCFYPHWTSSGSIEGSSIGG